MTSKVEPQHLEKPAYIYVRQSTLGQVRHHQEMEWAEITHPFHPLRGQRFPISKTMCVSGVDTLVLRTSSGGAFAIARDWTDHAGDGKDE